MCLVVVAATEWTLDQVAEWLREILLKKELVPVFASHGIDGAALMQLNNNKMRSMGLTAHQSHQVWRRLVCLLCGRFLAHKGCVFACLCAR